MLTCVNTELSTTSSTMIVCSCIYCNVSLISLPPPLPLPPTKKIGSCLNIYIFIIMNGHILRIPLAIPLAISSGYPWPYPWPYPQDTLGHTLGHILRIPLAISSGYPWPYPQDTLCILPSHLFCCSGPAGCHECGEDLLVIKGCRQVQPEDI